MNTETIRQLFDEYVVPTYSRSLVLDHGHGARVWDVEGKSYLDFGGGVAVNSLGHTPECIRRALEEQAAKLVHCSNLYYHEPQGLLARELVELTGPGKIFFCNSGAEANEALFKLARRFGDSEGRYEIITAQRSFHGRTLASIAATGQEKVKTGFGPLMPGFKHVPYNDFQALADALTPQTVAVMVEGIQGEGGIYPADPEFLVKIRRLTRERNILLLWDGIQCGFFRTGRFMSYQTLLEDFPGGAGFLPDGIAMAKSIGGGFPIGAAWMAKPYADLLQPGSHGTTYGGTPLACAVALAVLREVREKKLDANIRERGEQLKAGLSALIPGGKIEEVRGCGGMIGAAVAGSHLEAAARLREAGLLVVPAGTNVLRFLLPLNASEAEVKEALELVKNAL
jgi:predicted acetylornithine/succinylornithine family transaminase